MCDVCKKSYGSIEVTIIDASNKKNYCPNCLLIRGLDGEIAAMENSDSFICDVSGKPGAILYDSLGERYVLERSVLERLIFRNLKRKEYRKLIEKYDPSNYMLHEDFYAEDGTALQPANE